MGTDICMFAERRKNGVWERVGDVFKYDYYQPKNPISEWNKPFTNHPYHARSYDLFAILADVRNGSGFAGCLTGTRFEPISEPKGYPEDMSFIEDDFYGGHSASWLTLKELRDYDWEQTVQHYGVVSEDVYKEYRKSGNVPNSWSGGVWGRNIVTVDESTMDKILAKTMDRNANLEYYVQCKFKPVTYRECCSCFLDETLPSLEELIPEGGTAEDVRIIFDFDC